MQLMLIWALVSAHHFLPAYSIVHRPGVGRLSDSFVSALYPYESSFRLRRGKICQPTCHHDASFRPAAAAISGYL
ncbi:hypothetical protein V8C42DRAFT_327345 [Trichoderma barbatum]